MTTFNEILRDKIVDYLRDARCLWEFHTVFDEIKKSDALICLGSYDIRVAERCAELLKAGVADVAVITGGFGNWTRDKFNKPEAEIFAEAISQCDISRSRLLIESKATCIGENIEYSKELLPLDSIKRVTFITKPQTQMRVYGTVKMKWKDIESIITAPSLDFFSQARDEIGLINLIDEMVGDLQRILEYPDRGYQIYIDIPRDVLSSYLRLREAGFDKHCIRN